MYNKNFNPVFLGHTIGLMGITSCGKTELAATITTMRHRELLRRLVGETTATIIAKTIVYTSSDYFNNKLSVSIRKKLDPIGEIWHLMPIRIIEKLIFIITSNKHDDNFDNAIHKSVVKVFNELDNLENYFSLLDDESLNSIKKLLVKGIQLIHKEDLEFIYQTAEQSTSKDEVKRQSRVFKNALRDSIGEFLDGKLSLPIRPSIGLSANKAFSNLKDKVNLMLSRVFDTYFPKISHQENAFYTTFIDLDNLQSNTQQAFINAFFTNNDIVKNKKLSIEVLCEEIFIHTKLSDELSQQMSSDTYNELRDRNGNLTFAFNDHKGFFHGNKDKDSTENDIRDITFSKKNDAIIYVAPLHGNPHTNELNTQLISTYDKFSLPIPLFIVQNKLDLYYEQRKTHHSSILNDVLSLSTIDSLSAINESKEKSEEILQTESDLVSNIDMYDRQFTRLNDSKTVNYCGSYPLYLKPNKDMIRESKDLAIKYHPASSITSLFKSYCNQVRRESSKLRFLVDDINGDLSYSINQAILSDNITNVLNTLDVKNKTFSTIRKNIKAESGKIPNGNGYNALVRRLKLGNGYASNIDESYFVNCTSFEISYPRSLQKLVSYRSNKKNVDMMVEGILEIQGGTFSEDDKLLFSELILNHINPYTFTRNLVYEQILIKSRNGQYSFKSLFQNFLYHSDLILLPDKQNINAIASNYQVAFGRALREAIETVLARYVVNKLN